jgi:pilus assembly protein CpaF
VGVEAPAVANPELVRTIRARLSAELDPLVTNPFSTVPGREAIIRRSIAAALVDAGEAADPELVDALHDELVGLGPLQPWMADTETTDILVNRFDEIFVERRGRLERVNARFRDQQHLEQIIGKIVALVGREISIDKPLVDARMVDGSRANAVYAPVGGPTLCIRKFARLRLPLVAGDGEDSWTGSGGMSAGMAEALRVLAAAHATMLIAGATGAGKSTLLRSIISAFDPAERVITIEDTAELELDNPHWVKLECVHQNELAGNDSSSRRLDVADLVQNALRMRPDRLIIGEIRNSREAYHTLEALNTGHDGSATTIHASSARDALARLELLVGRSFGHLPPAEIRGYIARVFHVVVFVTRLRSGARCVTEIAELAGQDSGGDYDLRPMFTAQLSGDGTVGFTSHPFTPSGRLQRALAMAGSSWPN